jgi:hypothetical protein
LTRELILLWLFEDSPSSISFMRLGG